MKVSFIVPCRNKERNVGRTVDTVLAQTYSPMEVVLSDQGSEDGTLDILLEKAKRYDGPNDVWVLQCPDTERRGIAGLNAHLNWLHQQVSGDVVIMCSADDINHPDRVKHTVEAFEEHNPSYVGTRVRGYAEDGSAIGDTDFPHRTSRWIRPAEAFRHLIGSSASSAWAWDLYEKHGPLVDVEAQDVVLPPLALCERGLYYVDLPLHGYIAYADLNNTGTEGQMRAARDEVQMTQLVEVNNFSNVYQWTSVLRRLRDAGLIGKLDQAAVHELSQRIISTAEKWAGVRADMTMRGVDPVGWRL